MILYWMGCCSSEHKVYNRNDNAANETGQERCKVVEGIEENHGEKVNEHIKESVNTLFRVFDKNGDGCLDREECRNLIREGLSKSVQKYRQVSEKDLDAFIRKIDKNKDGKIQKQELYDHFATFA